MTKFRMLSQFSEAVGLARVLSTNESPKFVNGLLDKLRQVKPTLLA